MPWSKVVDTSAACGTQPESDVFDRMIAASSTATRQISGQSVSVVSPRRIEVTRVSKSTALPS